MCLLSGEAQPGPQGGQEGCGVVRPSPVSQPELVDRLTGARELPVGFGNSNDPACSSLEWMRLQCGQGAGGCRCRKGADWLSSTEEQPRAAPTYVQTEK